MDKGSRIDDSSSDLLIIEVWRREEGVKFYQKLCDVIYRDPWFIFPQDSLMITSLMVIQTLMNQRISATNLWWIILPLSKLKWLQSLLCVLSKIRGSILQPKFLPSVRCYFKMFSRSKMFTKIPIFEFPEPILKIGKNVHTERHCKPIAKKISNFRLDPLPSALFQLDLFISCSPYIHRALLLFNTVEFK